MPSSPPGSKAMPATLVPMKTPIRPGRSPRDPMPSLLYGAPSLVLALINVLALSYGIDGVVNEVHHTFAQRSALERTVSHEDGMTVYGYGEVGSYWERISSPPRRVVAPGFFLFGAVGLALASLGIRASRRSRVYPCAIALGVNLLVLVVGVELLGIG